MNKALIDNQFDTSKLELRTDNGSQYCAKEFKKVLNEHKIKHTRTRVNTPKNNSRIERFFKTIKYEYLNDYIFEDIEDVRRHVDYFIKFYNERRIHQSLGWKTPKEALDSLKQSADLNTKSA